jgi:hypothetical protein
LFPRRKRLRVDLTELEDKAEVLSHFLEKSIKGKVTSEKHSINVESEELSPEELKRMVNKFIYHQHLNNTCWVAVEDTVVTIRKFEQKKVKKRKKTTATPATIKHGWL